ncbi:MAG: histidine kinase dimerization/phospho-acceptor domain-containing protein [Acidobacteriota bacterium]
MSEIPADGWFGLRALASGLIHDLNNLLAPIFLYGDLLEQEAADEASKKKISTILSRADQIQTLLSSVRMLYKDDEWESFALPRTFLENLDQLLSPLARKNHASAHWYFEADAPSLPREVLEQKWRMILPLVDFFEHLEGPMNLSIFWHGNPDRVRIDAYLSSNNPARQSGSQAVSAVCVLPDGVALDKLMAPFANRKPDLSISIP